MKVGDKIKFPKLTQKKIEYCGIYNIYPESLPDTVTITEILPDSNFSNDLKGVIYFKEIGCGWPLEWFKQKSKSNNKNSDKGIKDFQGKISYQEIDWNFINAMAKRLNSNKIQFGGKYEIGNWKLDIDLKSIEDALIRHVISLINPNPEDTESALDHLAAIGVNSQILFYHLNKNKND